MKPGGHSDQASKRLKVFLVRRQFGRNNELYDKWSLAHLLTGVLLGWLLPPFLALTMMVLWEPLEILVLSPILARRHIDFGYETFKNSMSDIVVDIAGMALGHYVLLAHFAPPLHLIMHAGT